MRDPVKGLLHRHLPEGVLLTANCDVNIWNDRCQRFDVGRPTYAHFFSSVSTDQGAWRTVLEVLHNASDGAWSYDESHFEWNFGFNLVSLHAHRAIGFTEKYERLASQMLERRYLRGDSLIYGLGMAFFAFQGRVACYERSGFYVLDGLGYVPPAEMAVAGVTSEVISRAAVLHFNGERKPWGSRPFADYMHAMGDWGQALSPFWPPPSSHSDKPRTEADAAAPPSLTLAILLSGPRTGTEWLSKVMSDDKHLVCGSLDDRTAPHPESLMPFNVVCSNKSQVPCTAWSVEALSSSSCDLRLMCQWRYVLAAARGVSVIDPSAGGGGRAFEQRWHEWGRSRSATDVFEGYLRRMLRRPTSAPELPCRCEASHGVLFLKLFLAWLEPPTPGRLQMPPNAFQRRFARDELQVASASQEEAFDLVDVRVVFSRLAARILFMHREPIAQYVSIQRGRLFEAKGTPRTDKADAWHCFDADPSKCAQSQASGAEAIEVDLRDVGFFLQEARRLRAAAATFRPSFSREFEECTGELTKCINDIYAAVGLPPRSTKLAITPPRVSSSLSLVRNRDEVEAVARDVAAGNWTPGPPHEPGVGFE